MKKDINTNYFVWETTNPKQNIRGVDCVVRSISIATGQTWDKVYEGLYRIGYKMKRMLDDNLVYEAYFKELGWQKMPQMRKDSGLKYTGKEMAEIKNADEVRLVKMSHHLTCIKNNKIHDIWNCGMKTTGNYWVESK